jgi:hypothetical protein
MCLSIGVWMPTKMSLSITDEYFVNQIEEW